LIKVIVVSSLLIVLFLGLSSFPNYFVLNFGCWKNSHILEAKHLFGHFKNMKKTPPKKSPRLNYFISIYSLAPFS